MHVLLRSTIAILTILISFPGYGQSANQTAQKSFNQYNTEISKWMVAEATAATSADHELAVIQLVRLYRELLSDPRIRLSPTLNQYRVKVRARLMKVLRELEIRLTRQLAPANRTTSGKLQSALERHLAASSYSTGGARNFLTPRAGANVPDYGPHLVALIQRTIAPEFWNVNGGPGVIVYYPPLRLLVVRATSQVHGQIRGLNKKIR